MKISIIILIGQSGSEKQILFRNIYINKNTPIYYSDFITDNHFESRSFSGVAVHIMRRKYKYLLYYVGINCYL